MAWGQLQNYAGETIRQAGMQLNAAYTRPRSPVPVTFKERENGTRGYVALPEMDKSWDWPLEDAKYLRDTLEAMIDDAQNAAINHEIPRFTYRARRPRR